MKTHAALVAAVLLPIAASAAPRPHAPDPASTVRSHANAMIQRGEQFTHSSLRADQVQSLPQRLQDLQRALGALRGAGAPAERVQEVERKIAQLQARIQASTPAAPIPLKDLAPAFAELGREAMALVNGDRPAPAALAAVAPTAPEAQLAAHAGVRERTAAVVNGALTERRDPAPPEPPRSTPQANEIVSRQARGRRYVVDQTLRTDQYLLRKLQQRGLISVDPGPDDGKHGPKTQRAMEEFMRRYGAGAEWTASMRSTLRAKALGLNIDFPNFDRRLPAQGRIAWQGEGRVHVNENGCSNNPGHAAALQYARNAGNRSTAHMTSLAYRGRNPNGCRYLDPWTVPFGTVHFRRRENGRAVLTQGVPMGTLGVFTNPANGKKVVIVAGDAGLTAFEVSIAAHRAVGLSGDYRAGDCSRCVIQWYPGSAKPDGYRDEAELRQWMRDWGARMGIAE